jgi:sphinganine-1-phosphate aldolase
MIFSEIELSIQSTFFAPLSHHKAIKKGKFFLEEFVLGRLRNTSSWRSKMKFTFAVLCALLAVWAKLRLYDSYDSDPKREWCHLDVAVTLSLSFLVLGRLVRIARLAHGILPAMVVTCIAYRFYTLSAGGVDKSLLHELEIRLHEISASLQAQSVLPYISPARLTFFLGDILGVFALLSTYSLVNSFMYRCDDFTTVSALVKSVKSAGYDLVKGLPQVVRELEKEQRKLEGELEADIKTKARAIGEVNTKLPALGMSPKGIISLMEAEVKKEDVIWLDGKVSGAVYHGLRDHQDLLNKAFGLYSISNPLHPDIWPSAMKFESEIVQMVATMMNGSSGSTTGNSKYTLNPHVCGCTTSGGTESIILAIKSHRDYYRDVKGITAPELIACTSAHAAVDKACDLLGIKLVHVPMDTSSTRAKGNGRMSGGHRMSVDHAVAAITANTIMIYSSAPSYPQGVIDDIPTLSDVAQRYGVGLHVDCCLGGFVLPFAKMLQRDSASESAKPKRSSSASRKSSKASTSSTAALADDGYFYGQNIPDFDFGLPGVTSMSVDTHKYGFALKGASVVLYSSKSLRHSQYFCYSEWTGGMYTTPTIAGSRSGGLIAQCWASMMALGEKGYKDHTRQILDSTRIIARGVRDISGLVMLGDAAAMIVCFASADESVMNTYTVSDRMTKKGWSLNTLQNPACVHLCCTVRHVGHEEEFLVDLRDAVLQAKEAVRRGDKASGKAAIYGMASGMPSGPVNELLKCYNDVVLKV